MISGQYNIVKINSPKCYLLVLVLFSLLITCYINLFNVHCSLLTPNTNCLLTFNDNCNNNNYNANVDRTTREFSNFVSSIQNAFTNIGSTGNESIVYNLSNHTLTTGEKELLELGLKFCPTPPKADIGDLVHDIDHFFRSANLKLFFSDVDTSNDTQSSTTTDPNKPFGHPDLRLKSKFNPTFPPLLEFVRQSVITDLQSCSIKPVRQKNLTHQQFLAIKSLSCNPNIVIKPADKGSGIVVMNREDYIKEGERQLLDPHFYQKLDHDPTNDHCKKVSDLVTKMFDNGEITNNTKAYLTSNFERTAQFYMLPKIHKSLTNPPGRPITSGNDSPTEKISQLADIILQPFVPKIKSYVKDTNHFLSIVNNLDIKHTDLLLVTLDVTSLYTNIPHKEGIEAIEKLLNKVRPTSNMPKNSSIIEILKLVLTCNNFQFNGINYLQKNGTAMGTRVAPTYANLFMADYEDKYVYTYPLQPLLWVRYIDDCFMPWQHGMDELIKFVDYLNQQDENIQFTFEVSPHTINFLDTTVRYHIRHGFSTTLYTKPTDKHTYLHYKSCHPPHIMQSLPYSQFLRVRRLCTHFDDYMINSLEMAAHFSHRGYPIPQLLETLRKVIHIEPRHTQTQNNQQNPQTDQIQQPITLYLITTYNPSNPPIRKIIEKYWPILGRSSGTRILTKAKIIYGSRRPRNLLDTLVKAKLPSIEAPINKLSYHCLRPNTCKHCPRLDRTGTIKSHSTGRVYKTETKICCHSTNFIYCISCLDCGLQYVGQTRNTVIIRMNNHLSTIRRLDDLPLPNHMAEQHDNSQNPNIKIHIVEFIRPPSSLKAQELRDKVERKWITRLHTLVPHGLNLQD